MKKIFYTLLFSLLSISVLAQTIPFRSARFPTKTILVTPADVTAPTLVSATIPNAGNVINLLFNEAVNVSGAVPTISMTGGASTLSSPTGAGTTTLVYSLSRTVNGSETGTFSYTQPGNGIEDTSGNDFASVSGVSVINLSTQGSLTEAVATYTPGSTTQTWTTGQYYGAAFTTTASGLTVRALGRFMVLGNTGTHTVVIMDMSGTILASASVNMTGGTVDTFIYTTLGTPLVLSASTQYFIGSQETNAGDFGTGSSTLTTAAGISANTWQTFHTVAGVPSNDFDGGNKGYGVSLKY